VIDLRFLVVALSLVAITGGARADDFAERMAREHPAPCFEQIAPFVARDIVQRDLEGYVEGIGIGRKLGPEWKPGNRDYDEAFATASKAVSDHVANQGPIATIDMRAFFQRGFSRLAEQQRKPFADFLSTEAGKLSWLIIDDANCTGLLNSIERGGRLKLSTNEQGALASLKTQLAARQLDFERRVNALSPALQDSVSRNAQMFTSQLLKRDPGGPPPNRFGIDGAVIVEKLGRDMGGILPRLNEIIDRFAKAHANQG
jgi:hypothetical protein